jgi:hypothetical protein
MTARLIASKVADLRNTADVVDRDVIAEAAKLPYPAKSWPMIMRLLQTPLQVRSH